MTAVYNYTNFDCIINFFVFSRPAGGGKALKLGGKGKDVDSFVDKLRQEGTGMSHQIFVFVVSHEIYVPCIFQFFILSVC